MNLLAFLTLMLDFSSLVILGQGTFVIVTDGERKQVCKQLRDLADQLEYDEEEELDDE